MLDIPRAEGYRRVTNKEATNAVEKGKGLQGDE
jgi:hypothetical protein